MAAVEKEDSFLSVLFSNPNAKDLTLLSQKALRRHNGFGTVNVDITAFILLLSAHISRIHNDIPRISRSLPIMSEEIIKYLLSLIQQQSDYLDLLPVLKTLQSLTEGVGALSDPDIELLKDFVKKRENDIQEILNKRVTSISEEPSADTITTPIPSSSTEEKDERRESLMLKIYSQMKTGRKKTGSIPLLGVSPLKHWPQDKPIPLQEEGILKFNMECIKEQDGVQTLIKTCLDLASLSNISSIKKQTLVDDLVKVYDIKRCIDACMIAVSIATSTISLNSTMLTDLITIFKRCITAATVYTTIWSNATSSTIPVDNNKDSSTILEFSTVSELLQAMSCNQIPSNHTVKIVINDIVQTTIKMKKKIENAILKSPKSKVINVFYIIASHSILTGVDCLFTSKVSIAGNTQSSNVKLTHPLCCLLNTAIDMINSALQEHLSPEEVSSSSSIDEVKGCDLDINSSYTPWQLSCVVLKEVSLVHILVSSAQASFKKVLVAAEAPSREGSSTDVTHEPSFSELKPTRSDKEEQLFHRIQNSLSSKIPELPPAIKDGDSDEEKLRSVSPTSTVSSSGDVQGEYVINSGDEQQEEQKEDSDLSDEDIYENLEPLLEILHLSRPMDTTPIPTAPPPPPPPLPPKKSRSSKSMFVPIIGTTPCLPPRSIPRTPTSPVQMKMTFYLRLSVVSIKCLLEGLVQNPLDEIQNFLLTQIKPVHTSILSWLFLNVHSLSEDAKNSEKFNKIFHFREMLKLITDLLHEMVVNGIVTPEYHGFLLRDIGLHPACWPLTIPTVTLSLLARVLICRLQFSTDTKDDPLTLSIWNGFLSTLEDNAANEVTPDEDLSVTHLQLLLLIWHNFSKDTRKTLLLKSVNAVNRVAEEKESNVIVPPIAVCRLLLVLQYMIFQFSEPAPRLSEQVNSNLLMEDRSLQLSPAQSVISPQPFHPVSFRGILCYPCDQQLHFQHVLSKPGTLPKDGKNLQPTKTIYPLFYNVIPFTKSDPTSSFSSFEDDNDDDIKATIDCDACKILLKCGDGKPGSYDRFCQSLLTIMSCGIDYRLYSDDVYSRLMTACGGHQCVDLCLSLLTNLPPSFNILSSAVEGSGLNFKNDPNCSNLLILINLLSIQLQSQQIDIEDIVDTLSESGHTMEESEELVGKVMSIIGSTDHFITRSLSILEGFLSIDDDSSMLPLMSIIAINVLLSLLQRTIQATVCEEDGKELQKKDSEQQQQQQTESEETDKDKQKEDIKTDTVENGAEPDTPIHDEEVEFYNKYADVLVPVLLKVIKKLVSFAHMYICRNDVQSSPSINEDIERVITTLISVSGTKLVSSSKTKERLSFFSHLPVPLIKQLKNWNAAILLDQSLLDRIWTCTSDRINLFDELRVLVDVSIDSFATQQTFDSCRCLKTTISTSLIVLSSILELRPEESRKRYLEGVAPLCTDLITEFAIERSNDDVIIDLPLKEISTLYDKTMFRRALVKLRMMEYFKLVSCSELNGHTFQGVILEDLFVLIINLLKSSDDWPILAEFDQNTPKTNIADLILLCSRNSLSSTTITEGLQLIVKILELSDACPQDHLTVLCSQISSLGLVPKQRLQSFLRRVVVGSSHETISDIVNHVKLLRTFIHLLTKDDCVIPSLVCQSLHISLLPLGKELVSVLNADKRFLTVFKDYFHCCMMLAGKQSDPGHLGLVIAATKWLPNCIKLINSGWTIDNEMFSPLLTIMGYLSSLTSALELNINETKCMEKRMIANEDEYSVLENGEDDDSIVDEEEELPVTDDESLNDLLCTFTLTKREFKNQHWYHCHTCKLIDGTGCCNICVKVCHKGHDVTYSKFGSFFCDCGAKEDGSCKALTKRTSSSSRAESPVSGSDGTAFSDSKKQRRKRRSLSKKGIDYANQMSTCSQTAQQPSHNTALFPSSAIKRIAKQIDSYKDELKEFLYCSGTDQDFSCILREALPHVVEYRTKKAFGTAELIKDALCNLHEKKKKFESVDNIITAMVGCQENAIENMKLTLTGDQGQLIKQLLSNSAARRSVLCATLSSKGQGQLLAVGQDKGKISFYQLPSLMKQIDSSRHKLSVNRLGTTTVPFTILSLVSNLSCDEYIAVCGVKECQVLTINPSGQVNDKLKLQLSIDANGYLVKVFWVPGSQTELVVVTDTFIKIYNLSTDVISPTYYFTVFSDKIKDACMIIKEEEKYLVVMLSTGHTYFQQVVPECGASDGPIYLTVELPVQHHNIKEVGAVICEGGMSVFYSHSLNLLFLSYQNGKSFVTVLDGMVCKEPIQLNLINNTVTNNGKTTPTPLTDWSDSYQHPGLVCALTAGTCNLVTFLLKPDIIQMHELKSFPKSKIHGYTVIRPPSTGDSNQLHTNLILVCEDGSLRAYNANQSDSVQYWLKPQFQPVTPLAYLSLQSRKKSCIAKRTSPPSFAVDFFEQCQRMQNNEVDFLGPDILHVYNKEQVKHRFNVGGLYIANTRPGGFTIDVHNLQSETTVMVGLRVLLGGRSLERSPSTIEVFGRSKMVTFPSSNARWFDIPFSREESLQADKTFKLTFGSSQDPSGINMVDCVRVYIKTKDDFNWPERPTTGGLLLTRRLGDTNGEEIGGDSSEILNTGSDNQNLGSLEKLLCYTFSVLGNYCLSSSISSGVSDIILQATPLLGLNIPFGLQYQTKFFMSCAIKGIPEYHICKNHLQLSHILQALLSNPSDVLHPEQYQHFLIILLVIARLHPQHLHLLPCSIKNTLEKTLTGESVSYNETDGCGLWTNVIVLLNELFWLFYENRPNSPVTSSILSMGLIAVETTVCILIELMWIIIIQYPDSLSSCVPHFVKFLTSRDSQIGSACVKTLIRLLKPRPPKLPTPEPKEEKGEKKEDTDSSTPKEINPPPPQPPQQQQQLPIDFESVLANPAAAMDQLLSNPAVMGMMPDEDAMMNFAIAMSLHDDEGNPSSVQALHNVLQRMGLPIPGGLPQMDHQPNGNSDEEEEDDEEHEEEGVVSVHQMDDLQDRELVQSLNSSYEDLVPPSGDESGDVHSHLLVRRNLSGGGSKSSVGDGGKSDEERKTTGIKKDRARQDGGSEPDIPIDSSGEEDAEDTSFLDMRVYEQFDKASSDITDSSVDKTEKDNEQSVVLTKEHELRMKLLTTFAECIGDVEKVGGTQSIPYLQIILFLSSCLEGSHKDGETYGFLLNKLIARLQMEDTIVAPMMARCNQSEVLLLLLRFFNIIMSRKRMRSDKIESASANRLWYSTANALLQSKCMSFCLRILQGILNSKLNFKMEEVVSAKCDHNLLVPRSSTTNMDMGPFFQQQYVKNHASDVFETYSYLLADIALALPCQLKRFCEKTKSLSPLEFDAEWMETLCQYFMASSQTSSSGKKQIRKVLVYVCGSKEKYRLVRDKYALQSHFSEVMDMCSAVKFDPTNPSTSLIHLPYNSLKKLIEQLRLCDDIAKNRTRNWQSFCLEQKGVLPHLFLISLSFDEGLASTILQLLYSGLSGIHSSDEKETKKKDGGTGDKTKKEKSKEKMEDDDKVKEEQCSSLNQLFIEAINDELLVNFFKRFLLQSNNSNIRWQCHALAHSLYKHSSPTQKVHLVQLLWQLWPNIRGCGHKASQFVDLLGYCTISSPEVLAKESMCSHLVRQAVELLRKQNSSVQAHPNSHVYSQLSSLVDFDGYYLESDPCLVCNDPEVPFTMTKLYSMKSEVRYSPNTIFLKLNGSYMFSHLHMKINEIRRSKMIRVMHLYYSNRTIQNVIELKNNRSLWLQGAKCVLQQSQTEVKLDFPLPVVARNLIVEFSDFYENAQGATEVLQCPRCNTAVPAHPGVCSACGENVHQCHKCRAINYDERDPFLCNSCGFSKYARFDIQVETSPCSAVDPIENEDDKKKTLANINHMLEKADGVYKELVQHRNQLDNLLVALASGAVVISRSGSSESGVNKAIQAVAQLYCQNCKGCYQDLSKAIQIVLASRKELVTYDMKKLQSGKITPSEPSTPITPVSSNDGLPLSFSPSTTPQCVGNCFGCASSTLEHCITILKALAFKSETRKLLVNENLIEDLVEFNLRSGSADLHKDVQRLLCQLTRDNLEATTNLNEFITEKVFQQIKHQRISPNLISEVQPEIQLLTASIAMEDSCWEARLKTVMSLFRKSRGHKSPVVMAAITMPCLKIIHSLINPKTTVSAIDKKKLYSGGYTELPTSVTSWLKGDSNAGFNKWKESILQKATVDSESIRETELARKYSRIWMDKTLKSKVSSPLAVTILKQSLWLKGMLFNPSSQAARKMACNILYSLCDRDIRQKQIIDLLSTFLDQVGNAGEASKEYLELFQKLTEDETGRWKLYLARREILVEIGELIVKEIDYLLKLEESTLSSDLSQGYALRMLTVLLKSFLAVDSIKNEYKAKLVRMVLNGYLSLKRLVTQRTKRIDECQKLLLKILEDLTSGGENEKHDFMRICVETLSNISMNDMVTPIFIFEQLCNIILPEEEDIGEFFLSLEKDPQQEEFLQGRMQGNPYSCEEPGLGPLMRDIKNKICTDCELVALLEDDTGMELLVCNKIISLDLPVKEVYKKIWCAQPNATGKKMKVIYRMRGLLGDATEDMIEKLGNNKGQDVDEEQVYKMAAVLEPCNGLDATLIRLSQARDFVQSHGLISAGLKLLGYCSKVKVNRQYLIQDRLNTLNILLEILNMSLRYEQRESNGIGAAVAQQVLSVTEPILQESASQQRVIVRTISEEAPVDTEDSNTKDTRLSMLLSLIESPFVQSNLSVREGLMQIIPFLTFGDPRNMTVLLKHFAPYLDFEKFDSEQTPENSLYLDCFCVVANGIGKDESGVKLKDLAIEMKITTSATDYIEKKTPTKGVRLESKEWTECVSLPSLPYVLKMLAGLSHCHTKTQLMVCEVVSQIHLLEQVSSTQHRIGTLAETLLETMRENTDCKEKINKVRKDTRNEKKKLAMEMRAKELGALGFQVNDKGQLIAKTPTAFKDIEKEVVEETGLRCCICLEGYRNQPQKILGIYTFTKKVTLDEFENKPRKTQGCGTVSHFNVVHYDCHSSAIKLARSREEWESATLQNANTRCNGLLPIWGPSVSDSAFASSLARHNAYIQECTGLYDPSFRSYAHDLRLILLRYSYETSFSSESGGGGPQSNLRLIPYLIHVILYIIDTTRVFQREEKNLTNVIATTRDKWVPSAYELEGPLYSVTISLLIFSLPQWEEHKLVLLRQLLVMAHARSISSAPIKSFPSPDPAPYTVYRPVLILFALVDAIHRMLKKSLTTTGPELLTSLLDFIRNNDVTIGEDCDKLLSKYQDEVLPIESFAEFCDVNGLLGLIENPDSFLKELIASVAGSN